MLFDFILKRNKPDAVENFLTVRGRQIPLAVIRNHRARRYLLRFGHRGATVRGTKRGMAWPATGAAAGASGRAEAMAGRDGDSVSRRVGET